MFKHKTKVNIVPVSLLGWHIEKTTGKLSIISGYAAYACMHWWFTIKLPLGETVLFKAVISAWDVAITVRQKRRTFRTESANK